MTILKNKCRCKKCGTVIESKHRHDFAGCECGSIYTDGGTEYIRRGWPEGDANDWIEEMSEFDDNEG